MDRSDIKFKLLEFCKKELSERKFLFLREIAELKESMENETKSSVGDKHETARARMQFEEEKLNKQMASLTEMIETLNRFDPHHLISAVSFGSVVETEQQLFFIAIPFGKVEMEGKSINIISFYSPLAKIMKDKKPGDQFEFNNRMYSILKLH